MASRTVNFITGNKNKLGEVKAILEPTITVQNQPLDLIEVQGTLEEVTLAKCRSAAEQVRTYTFSPPPSPFPTARERCHMGTAQTQLLPHESTNLFD